MDLHLMLKNCFFGKASNVFDQVETRHNKNKQKNF